LQPKVPTIMEKIRIAYRSAREREQRALGQYLAARAVRDALIRTDASYRAYLRALVGELESAPGMNREAQRTLARYGAEYERLGDNAAWPLNPDEKHHGHPTVSAQTPLQSLDAQVSAEGKATHLADEMMEGLKGIVSETLDLGTDSLKELGWSVVE